MQSGGGRETVTGGCACPQPANVRAKRRSGARIVEPSIRVASLQKQLFTAWHSAEASAVATLHRFAATVLEHASTCATVAVQALPGNDERHACWLALGFAAMPLSQLIDVPYPPSWHASQSHSVPFSDELRVVMSFVPVMPDVGVTVHAGGGGSVHLPPFEHTKFEPQAPAFVLQLGTQPPYEAHTSFPAHVPLKTQV